MELHRDIPTITIRGAFGYSLAQILEADTTIVSNSEKVALFKKIFKPENESGEAVNSDTARPYVLRGWFSRPDRKSFILELCLFGEASSAEALFDKTIENLCRMGLGRNCASCRSFKLMSDKIDPYFPICDQIVVDFISPTRISKTVRLDDGSIRKLWLNEDIPFSALFARLVNRYDELLALYSKSKTRLPQEHISELKRKSFEISSEKLEGGRFKSSRRSGRTGEELTLDGFVGKMLYSGNFSDFADILRYLPWVHVGKATALGCGWTTIECMNVEGIGTNNVEKTEMSIMNKGW